MKNNINVTKLVKEMARERIGSPRPSSRINDKRHKPPKHKKRFQDE